MSSISRHFRSMKNTFPRITILLSSFYVSLIMTVISFKALQREHKQTHLARGPGRPDWCHFHPFRSQRIFFPGPRGPIRTKILTVWPLEEKEWKGAYLEAVKGDVVYVPTNYFMMGLRSVTATDWKTNSV